MNPRYFQKGFTLVELIAVLVLISILGGITLTRFFSASNMQLQSSRDTIVAAFFSAQQKAMAQTLPVRLIASASSIDIRIDQNNNGNFDDDGSANVGGVQYPLTLIGGQSLDSGQFDFDRLGRTDSSVLSLSQSGRSVSITISANGAIE